MVLGLEVAFGPAAGDFLVVLAAARTVVAGGRVGMGLVGGGGGAGVVGFLSITNSAQ